jgi:hypothetical protein
MCQLPGFFPSDPQLLLCHRMMHASLRSIAVAFLSCQFVGGFSHVIGTPRNYLGPQLVVKWRHGLHGGQATIGGFQADYIAKTMSQSLRLRQVRAPSLLRPSLYISGMVLPGAVSTMPLSLTELCSASCMFGTAW